MKQNYKVLEGEMVKLSSLVKLSSWALVQLSSQNEKHWLFCFASGHSSGKTIFHCFIFREDNCPLLRRQLYSAQFMVKITVFREDNQPVLHLQRRQSASASHFEKTIIPVLKKTILLEKTILPFPFKYCEKATKSPTLFWHQNNVGDFFSVAN